MTASQRDPNIQGPRGLVLWVSRSVHSAPCGVQGVADVPVHFAFCGVDTTSFFQRHCTRVHGEIMRVSNNKIP